MIRARVIGRLIGLSCLIGTLPHAMAQPQPGWEVRLAERVEVVAGTAGTLALAIAVDRGLTVSKDAAVIVDVTPDPAVIVKRRRLGRSDAVDPDADTPRFAIPVRAETVGDFAVRVRVRFWVCAARTCRPVDVVKTATVAVTSTP